MTEEKPKKSNLFVNQGKNSREKQQIKTLTRKHRRMARVMYNENIPASELAKRFKLSRAHVAENIVKSKVFQNFMADLEEFEGHEQSILKRRLIDMGDKAVDALDDDLGMDVTGVQERRLRQSAAKDVLTRIDVVGEADKEEKAPASVINLTQINIKELTIAEKHDLAARLMQQPVDV